MQWVSDDSKETVGLNVYKYGLIVEHNLTEMGKSSIQLSNTVIHSMKTMDDLFEEEYQISIWMKLQC